MGLVIRIMFVSFVLLKGLVAMISLLMVFCLLQCASNQDNVGDGCLFIARG